jgi:hypothetical protein
VAIRLAVASPEVDARDAILATPASHEAVTLEALGSVPGNDEQVTVGHEGVHSRARQRGLPSFSFSSEVSSGTSFIDA